MKVSNKKMQVILKIIKKFQKKYPGTKGDVWANFVARRILKEKNIAILNTGTIEDRIYRIFYSLL